MNMRFFIKGKTMGNRKYKIIISILCSLIVISVTVFGVFALQSATMAINSNVMTFTATGIKGNVYACFDSSTSVMESEDTKLGDVNILSGGAGIDTKIVDSITYYKVASFDYGQTQISSQILKFDFMDKYEGIEGRSLGRNGVITDDPVIVRFLIENTGINRVDYVFSVTSQSTYFTTVANKTTGFCLTQNSSDGFYITLTPNSTANAGFTDAGLNMSLTLVKGTSPSYEYSGISDDAFVYMTNIIGGYSGYFVMLDDDYMLEEEIILPDMFVGDSGEHPVYGIAVGSYNSQMAISLQHITLPTTLLYIDIGCFSDFESLEEIYLPISLMMIDLGAFENCNATIIYEGTMAQLVEVCTGSISYAGIDSNNLICLGN